MTSNVLPLHFAPSQTSSSQNSNVDDTLEGYKIKSALPYKFFSTLTECDPEMLAYLPDNQSEYQTQD